MRSKKCYFLDRHPFNFTRIENQMEENQFRY